MDHPMEFKQLRHEEITEEMILANPFVFALNQAKMNSTIENNESEFGKENMLRFPESFNMYNKRVEFPYDIVENAMKIDPLKDN